MDLQIAQLNWLGFGIGGGFAISTPVFKLRYSDAEWRRCLSILVHFMGAQACLTLPLWVERTDT